jgi:hypothetical protein
MQNITHRLQMYLDLKNLSTNEFEATIGVSQGTISKALLGKTNFRHSVLWDIFLKFPEINMDWLVTGRGAMLVDQSAPLPMAAEPVAEYGTNYKAKYFETLEKYTALLERAQHDTTQKKGSQ